MFGTGVLQAGKTVAVSFGTIIAPTKKNHGFNSFGERWSPIRLSFFLNATDIDDVVSVAGYIY